MNSTSNWLKSRRYELINCGLFKNKLYKVRNRENGSTKLLKITSIDKLDRKYVDEVVNTMNRINNEGIKQLIKYKIIEINDNTLCRIMKEYNICLDDINPVEYFEETGPFDILYGILVSLIVLDENNSFHGDLKPSNIFINEENEVIVSDYLNNALFKGNESLLNRSGKDMCFVSIDEILGKEVDIVSDIWNFGLVLYYIRSGNYPFYDKNSVLKILNNIQWVNYNIIMNEDYEVNEFLKKLLKSDKEDRIKLNEAMIELKKENENNNNRRPPLPFDKDKVIQMVYSQKWDEAIPYLKLLLDRELPRSVRCSLNHLFGNKEYEKHNYKQAAIYFLNAVIYSCSDEERELNNELLGSCYIKIKDYNEGVKCFLRAFSYSKTKESKCQIYLNLGACYYGMKDYEQSLKYHLMTLKENYNNDFNALSNYNISQCYFEMREDEKAFKHLEEGKRLSKDDAYLNYLYYEIKGLFHSKRKEIEESKECCETALKLLKDCDKFDKLEKEEKNKEIHELLDKLKE